MFLKDQRITITAKVVSTDTPEELQRAKESLWIYSSPMPASFKLIDLYNPATKRIDRATMYVCGGDGFDSMIWKIEFTCSGDVYYHFNNFNGQDVAFGYFEDDGLEEVYFTGKMYRHESKPFPELENANTGLIDELEIATKIIIGNVSKQDLSKGAIQFIYSDEEIQEMDLLSNYSE